MDEPAKTAAEQLDQEDDDVIAAISEAIGPQQRVRPITIGRSRRTTRATPTSAESGSATTASGSAGTSQTSRNSDGPSHSSKTHWQKPKIVRGFAAQANDVATRVLNGEIDLEIARTYSSVARTIAQSMSIEVTRARFLKELPDLSLESDDE